MSRTWRDVILRSPIFWHSVDLSPGRANMTLAKSHVARSCQLPSGIIIRSWQSSRAQLSALLDDIVLHVHRWRTFDVRLNSHYCLQSVLAKVNDLKFFLSCAVVITTAYIKYPTLLHSENSPALQSLELRPLIPMDDFPSGRRITDLSLQFSPQRLGPQRLGPLAPPSPLSEKLTTLKLAYSDNPPLKTDSISLPCLTSLTLKAMHPRELISAMVVPNLSYLCFTTVFVSDDTLFRTMVIR